MFNQDLWSEILFSIRKNKLRTFLTGFSVAWGIFILVLLLASVDGMKNGFKKGFNDDANNGVFIRFHSTTLPYGGYEAGRKIVFTNSDLDWLMKTFKGQYEYLSPRLGGQYVTSYKKESGEYRVTGVFPDHKYLEKTKIKEGRYIERRDVESRAKVVVIGRKLVKEIYKNENPIGKNIQIGSLIFMVIGVFTDEGNEREETKMYAPFSTMQMINKSSNSMGQVVLSYNPKYNLKEALAFSENLETILKKRFSISPDDQSAINVFNYAEAFSNVSNFTDVLNIISLAVGFLILISGIVGIGNIMIFVIKERTKEIGIRKAIGAKPSQIITLVLTESIFITALSGTVGLLIAFLLVHFLSPHLDFKSFSHPQVDLNTIITSLIALVVSGGLAGFVPALKASKIKPIIALRND